jgi:hypothetical protein
MRISDRRYSRDLRRYSLAMRLIRHEARTQTIIAWSGLSMYRIRTLYRAYGTGHENPGVLRPRGRPPHQLSFFWRSARLASEAATLAGIARLLNVFPANPAHDAPEPLNSLQRGEGVCAAYELFHAYIPAPEISIDHAFLLVSALSRGDEVRLGHCVACDGLILVDCLKPPRQTCAYCSSAMKKAL